MLRRVVLSTVRKTCDSSIKRKKIPAAQRRAHPLVPIQYSGNLFHEKRIRRTEPNLPATWCPSSLTKFHDGFTRQEWLECGVRLCFSPTSASGPFDNVIEKCVHGDSTLLLHVIAGLANTVIPTGSSPPWLCSQHSSASNLDSRRWCTPLLVSETLEQERSVILSALARLSDTYQHQLPRRSLPLVLKLSALCLCSNDTDAIKLATSLKTAAPEAMGCAVIAYCAVQAACGHNVNKEEHWMSLWKRIVSDDEEKATTPVLLDEVLRDDEVRVTMVVWRVHCCVSSSASYAAQCEEINQILSLAATRYAKRHHIELNSAEFTTTCFRQMFSHLSLGSQRDLMLKLPFPPPHDLMLPDVLTAYHVLCRLVEEPPLPVLSPSVSRPPVSLPLDVPLQTRILHCILLDINSRLSQSTPTLRLFREHFASAALRIQKLWSGHNTHALAASLISPGEGAQESLVAVRSDYRAQVLHSFLTEMRDALLWLMPSKRRRTCPRKEYASYIWYIEQRSAADRAVHEGVQLLVNLFTLCASRSDSLPQRKSLPLWRRKLAAMTTLRSHKYEVLLSELPHNLLAEILQALLRYGFMEDATALGACLVTHSLVDVRFYSLATLGSLTLAFQQDTLGTSDQVVRDVLASLYRQRRSVFGDDEATTPRCHRASSSQMSGREPFIETHLTSRYTGAPFFSGYYYPAAAAASLSDRASSTLSS